MRKIPVALLLAGTVFTAWLLTPSWFRPSPAAPRPATDKNEHTSASAKEAPVLGDAAAQPADSVPRPPSPAPNRSLLAPTAAPPLSSLLTYGRAYFEQTDAPDAQGQWREIRIAEADFKHPLIRVETIYEREAGTGLPREVLKREMVGDHMIVRLLPGVPESALLELSRKHGMRLLRKLKLPGAYLVQFPAMTIDALPDAIKAYAEETESIAYAEPDYIVHASQLFPNDPDFGELYGLHNTGQAGGLADADIDAPEAWAISTGGVNVVVGVVDTGVDYSHPDLAANMWLNPDEIPGDQIDNDGNGYADDVHGWDFFNDDPDPFDDNSHGTHCAGTIGAAGNNGIGVAGVNWQTRIMALKFLGAGGSGATSDAVDALAYAVMMKQQRGINIRLTSNSWGGGGASQSLEDAIALTHDNDILFVAAAGNNAANNDALPHYPSSHTNANIIAVAATDRNDQRAGFSNYGALSVDLGAPGAAIYSTIPGNEYGLKSGTSMATPHVAGVAALMLATAPDASWFDVKDALLAGVDPVASMAGITVSGGRLNAFGALRGLGMRVRATIPARNDTVATPPASVVVVFNHAFDTNTLHASDCLLNGVAADAFEITGAATVAFHFPASPVTNEGPQVIDVPEGAVTRLDSPQSNRAYQATFRYDILPMSVVATEPADGATAQLPLTNIVLHLNEPVLPASIGAGDLAVSQGSVISATLLDAQTVSYALQGVAKEGELRLRLLTGALTDSNLNPSIEHSFSINLDIASSAFPVPFERISPAGALIYEGKGEAFITENDTDEFTLAMNAGHTIAAWVEPPDSLQPILSLLDPSGNEIVSAAAPYPTENAVLQARVLQTGGVYTLRVGGADGSTGNYMLHALINAAVEEETLLFTANNSLSQAQPIDSSFITLGHAPQTRAAVRGQIRSTDMQTLFSESFESGALGANWTTWSSLPEGRILVSDDVPASDGNHSLLMDRHPAGSNNLNEAVWSVDLSGLNRVELRFMHAQWNEERQIWLNNRRTGHFNADSISISDKGGAWYQVWRPAAQPTGLWFLHTVDLTPAAELGRMRFGPDFQIKFQQYDNEARPHDGQGFDAIEIRGPVPTEDWYRFDLNASDVVDIRLAPDGAAVLDMELYNAANMRLRTASHRPDSNETSIPDVPILQSGTYYVRVIGAGEVDYTLLVLRNAAFETEPNDGNTHPRDITHAGGAMGDVRGSAALYAYEAPSLDLGSILTLDPQTLAVRDAFTAPYFPGTLYGAVVGEMSFDGDFVWFTGGRTTGNVSRIFKINRQTGDAVAHFDVVTPSVITGVGSLNGELFLGTQQHTIDVYDNATFVKKRSLPDVLPGWLTGLEGSEARNLIFASAKADTLYALNPQTGAIAQQQAISPRPDGIEIALGLAPGEAFVANYAGDDEMLVFDSLSLQMTRKITWPGSPLAGLGGTDTGGPFETFALRVNAGDTITLRVTAPGNPLSAIAGAANDIALAVELTNPEGDAVAIGATNEEVIHVAEESGAYGIRVTGVNRSSGEYFLTVTGSTVAPTNSSTLTIMPPPDVFMECGDNLDPSALGSASVESDCASAIIVAYADAVEPGACEGAYTIVRTWSAQDACGSIASNQQLIHVTDTQPPLIAPPPDARVAWGAGLQPNELGAATASDACGAASITGFSDAVTNAVQTHEIRIVRTWRAEDACGNAASMQQTITITNVIPPVMDTPPAYALGDKITVTWSGPHPADLFQAQLATTPDFSDAQTTPWQADSTLALTGLTEDVRYYYRARAALTNSTGNLETDWSEPVASWQLSAAGDWDGDGMDNHSETLAGTDPLDTQSSFELLDLVEENGQIKVVWKGGTNVTQYIDFKPGFSSEEWETLHTNEPPSDTTNMLFMDPPIDRDGGIYRVRTTQ